MINNRMQAFGQLKQTLQPNTGFLGGRWGLVLAAEAPREALRRAHFKANGDTTTMTRQESSLEASIQKAFGLLLEMRGHRNAGHLLHLAVVFLNMLLQHGNQTTSPVTVSIQAVRIREP
jgi:hypothetical protein